jgi:hypothetical protein
MLFHFFILAQKVAFANAKREVFAARITKKSFFDPPAP